jgi:hypothetical protein
VLAVTDSPAGLGTPVVAPVAQCGHDPVRLIRLTPPTRPTGRTRHTSSGRVARRRRAHGRGSRPGARPQSFASETSRSPVLRQVTLATGDAVDVGHHFMDGQEGGLGLGARHAPSQPCALVHVLFATS